MAIDEQREFRDVIARMVFSFNGEMDSPKRKSYARMLEGIAIEVIELALDRLIDENAGGRQFFPMPTPADLKAACAKVIDRKRADAWRLMLPEACETCQTSRWKEVTDTDGVTRLTRCDCWLIAQKAMEAVGQRLALPAPSRPELGEMEPFTPIPLPEGQ